MHQDTERNRPRTFLSLQQNMLSQRNRQSTSLFPVVITKHDPPQFFIAEMAEVTKDGRTTEYRRRTAVWAHAGMPQR